MGTLEMGRVLLYMKLADGYKIPELVFQMYMAKGQPTQQHLRTEQSAHCKTAEISTPKTSISKSETDTGLSTLGFVLSIYH